MNSQSYTDLFTLRGGEYDRAMRLNPSARDQEFLQAIEKVNLTNGMKVIDVPAGGEYLRSFLPDGIIYFPHEPCDTFYRQNNDIASNSLLPLPFEENGADVLFSIAGVHHLEDKTELFNEFFRVLGKTGTLVLSDVREDSKVAKFLDNYVGSNNTTGHQGIFLHSQTASELKKSGFSIISDTIESFYWIFDDILSMGIFCNTLFDIKKVSSKQTVDAIIEYLGIDEFPDGKVGMRWELHTIVARKS
ncbi:MAG: methyltransferase domain-containing protein [Sulfuricurvum sp.]|uniref:class I SAM-dependent methyltransferase n=1 Tax=Sulfuricurvum sp. TaxID=2025608 RepID=UPI0025DC9AC9|nr:methyltransferase domain-containing protein [Sulfuricurvum sp.]MBV5320307.1 methyltransferase domain-containing protein [Sulfuricurvum sp.]